MEKRRRAKRDPQLPPFELLRAPPPLPPIPFARFAKAAEKGVCYEPCVSGLTFCYWGRRGKQMLRNNPVFLPQWLCWVHRGPGGATSEAGLGGTCVTAPQVSGSSDWVLPSGGGSAAGYPPLWLMSRLCFPPLFSTEAVQAVVSSCSSKAFEGGHTFLCGC